MAVRNFKIFSLFIWALISTAVPAASKNKSFSCELRSQSFGPFESGLRDPAEVRPLASLEELHFLSWNVLNFYWHVGKLARDPETGEMLRDEQNQITFEKPSGLRNEEEIGELGKVVREINADVGLFQEVEGGLETLSTFDDEELGDSNYPFLVQGNDLRGIDVGALVAKNLPLQYHYVTFRDALVKDPSLDPNEIEVFSRDAPALVLRARDADPNGPPYLVVVNTHNKSKRPSPGDPESTKLRSAQAKVLAKIFEHFKELYGEDVPFLLVGDLNTPTGSSELLPLVKAGLVEAFDLLDKRPSEDELYTHAYFPKGKRVRKRKGKPKPKPTPAPAAQYHQVDAWYLSPALQNAFSLTSVYRYHDADGKPLDKPKSYEERKKQPSDHNPIELILNAKMIFENYVAALKAKGLDSAEFIASLEAEGVSDPKPEQTPAPASPAAEEPQK